MVDGASEPAEMAPDAPVARRRRGRWLLRGIGLLFALLLALAWFNRMAIVDRIVSGQLAGLGLPGKYRLESAGLGTQVLTDIVIGDPARPDLTIERAEVVIVPTLGLPTVGRVTLLRPRLYGTVRQAGASFGSLDKLLFGKSEKPAGLPDLDLRLIDGRARLDTGFGPVGIKAEGRGNVSGGFKGIIAAVAPRLAVEGCETGRATLFGTVRIDQGQPRLAGPLRLGAVACPARGLRLDGVTLGLDLRGARSLDALAGQVTLAGNGLAASGLGVRQLAGDADFSLRTGDAIVRYRLRAAALGNDFATGASLTSEGVVRSRDGFARIEGEGTLAAADLRPGTRIERLLADTARSHSGNLAGPLAAQLRAGLLGEAPGSRLAASFQIRGDSRGTVLTVPRAGLTGRSGATVLALSRFQLATGGGQAPRLSGNIVTGGVGLPQLWGRIERRPDGSAGASFALEDYRAGSTTIALPRLVLAQTGRGELGFAGRAVLSGLLPGGKVDRLVLPLDGNWSALRGLALWRGCIAPSFRSLAVGGLALDARTLRVCPGSGGAILRSTPAGVRLAAGMRGLELSGRLGDSPVRIGAGALGLAWPGAFAARDVTIALGGDDARSDLTIADLRGRTAGAPGGTFAGLAGRLAAVPLNLDQGAGAWAYAAGDLRVEGASFRLTDRERAARFQPLIARDAGLLLHEGTILAEALLREPSSDRPVVRASLSHDLARASGHADLTVPGLVFDRRLQPDMLSLLAQGVIANASGTVTGTGRIDWTPRGVSSRGTFTSAGLDFAAAFGQARGVAGTVEFTDLLGMITAPGQRLKIAAIDPGIEVNDGELTFQLAGNNTLLVGGARWPFVDGTLELLPTRMVLGAAETRRYTLRLTGANAARFIERLDLANLAATGVFDGDIPIVFDENGGHVVGGRLVSRAPGGNISYVGELTYKDLSAMGNLAFRSLRSLDYRTMEIALDGNLDGEILTRLRFDGVSQGAGTSQNIATRAIKGLPIQFNVNIRAPFQKLVASVKSLYDQNYIPDPHTIRQEGPPAAIQPSDSRERP